MGERELAARVRQVKIVKSVPAVNFYDLGTEFASAYQIWYPHHTLR